MKLKEKPKKIYQKKKKLKDGLKKRRKKEFNRVG
jgi:hypothetical protein